MGNCTKIRILAYHIPLLFTMNLMRTNLNDSCTHLTGVVFVKKHSADLTRHRFCIVYNLENVYN